jgi:erythromycin esterase
MSVRRVVLWRCLAFALGLFSGVDTYSEQSDTDAVVECATRYATPIDEAAARLPLADVVGGAKAVALGEPTHGAHEPLQLRNLIVRDLVENLEFTAVALETSFAESQAINDFVTHGSTTSQARTIARQNLSWGFGEYVENQELIDWLEHYNENPAHVRRVHFYGIDLSGSDRHGSFSAARIAVDHALDVLQAVEPGQVHKLRARLEPMLKLFSDKDYRRLAAGQDKALENGLKFIRDQLVDRNRELTARIPYDVYEWTLQNMAVARRLQEYFRAAPPSSPAGDELGPDDYLQEEVRDAGMADNVEWMLSQEGARGRVIVFAHNGHVMNSPLLGGIWSTYRRAPRTMGQQLRTSLGSRLIIIGTLAESGPKDAPKRSASLDSTEVVLARAAKAPFVLNLHKAACDRHAEAWLSARRPIRANADTQLDVELGSAFDAIVLLDRITPAHRQDYQ